MLAGFIGGLLIGIPFLLIWYFQRKRATQSLRWPSVPGTVLESQLVQVRDADGDMSTQAQIKYTYQVAGAVLSGQRVAIGSGGRPAELVRKYPAGASVDVFYDPKKPSSAVLQPGGAGLKALLAAGIAVIAVVTGIGLVQQMSAGRRNASPEEYRQAAALYSAQKFGEAKNAFEKLAAEHSPQAQMYLGVMYAKGQGVPQNFVEAEKWFILAGQPAKSNREEIGKGLTAAEQKEAENRAIRWNAENPGANR